MKKMSQSASPSWPLLPLLATVGVVLLLVGQSLAFQLPSWTQIVQEVQNETAIANGTAPPPPLANASAPVTRSLVGYMPSVNQIHGVVSPQQRRGDMAKESIQIDFIPHLPAANGNQQFQGSTPPVVHAAAQVTPDQRKQLQQSSDPNLVQNLVINPADIQFTVPDQPDSVGLQIIDQIRAQLGTKPLPLSELNQKFVSFTANVPGVMINRTVVTNLEEQVLDQQNRTITGAVVRGVPATAYGSSSSTYSSGPTNSYSTQYQPIVSYPYNPALSYQRRTVDPYSAKTYSEQTYQYTVPQVSSPSSSYQIKPETVSYQQPSYQKPQNPAPTYQSQSYQKQPQAEGSNYNSQQQQTQPSYQAQSYQKQSAPLSYTPPQQTQSYTPPQQTQSYTPPQATSYQKQPQESYQKPVQSSYAEQPQQQQYQQPQQPVKIVYIEVCSSPQVNNYGQQQQQQQPQVQQYQQQVPVVQQQQYQPVQTYQQPQQPQQTQSYQSAQPNSYNNQGGGETASSDLYEVASGLGTIGGEMKSSVNEAGNYASASYQAVGEANDIVQRKLAQMNQLQAEMAALQNALKFDNYAIQLPTASVYSSAQSYSTGSNYGGGGGPSYGQSGYNSAPKLQQTTTSYGPNYSTASLVNSEEYSAAKLEPKVQQQSNNYSQTKQTYSSGQPQQQYKQPTTTNSYNQQAPAYQQPQASYSAPQQQQQSYNSNPNLKITSKVSEEKMTINSQQPQQQKPESTAANYGTPKYN